MSKSEIPFRADPPRSPAVHPGITDVTAGRRAAAVGTAAALGLGLALLAAAPRCAAANLKVLWLGGGPAAPVHDPAAMRDVLKPVFEAAGMTVDYKTNETILQADSLGRYDVLYIYNAKKGKATDGTVDLTAAQEDALYAWVRAGHTIIGVHSANSSYLANPRYLQLFGGEFTTHGDTEAYKYITVVNASHPAMQGVSAPPAAGDAAYWDEGREAKFTKTDTVMLERAKANGKQEPWTWVRPEGKGWVYYTSSGHDARVWNDVNFQKGLVQALKWGAGTYNTTALWGRPQASEAGPGDRLAGYAGYSGLRILDVTGVMMRSRTGPGDGFGAAPGGNGLTGLASGIYFLLPGRGAAGAGAGNGGKAGRAFPAAGVH